MDSTSDSHVSSDTQKVNIKIVKDLGQSFLLVLNGLPQGREIDIAKTNIEQSVMWAIKGITK